MGLPPDCADFVYVCMEGKEGTASMSEYFHMLEVCKQMFGIDDNNYYTVSHNSSRLRRLLESCSLG
jgi:hypothetical protein